MKRILFITHDASQSGAPLVLLYLMQWIKKNKPNFVFDILFLDGGLLEDKFKKLTQEQFYIPRKKQKKTIGSILKNKFINLLKLQNKNNIYYNIARKNYDIIYSNTVISARYGNLIKEKNPKIKHIVHVHELNTILKTLAPNFKNLVSNIDHFIAVSKLVEKNLIENYDVSKKKISVIYECAKIDIIKEDKINKVFTVGACGLSYWRKGNDLFLQVARYINKKYPDLNIKFIWVGNEYKDKPIIDADIEKLGLIQKVFFVGETSNTAQYFNNFDVFLMPSREDPFPLVCIEVAHLKKPIICFKDATGSSEVLEKGGGYVVPYLDIEAMGEKVVYYFKNPKTCLKDGEKAYELFKEFSPENICPQYFQAMLKILNE